MKNNIHFWSYLAQFFLELKTFLTNVVQKIKIHASLFFEIRAVYEKMSKNIVEPATDENMAHAHCMLYT
jgi:hypothetical protein